MNQENKHIETKVIRNHLEQKCSICGGWQTLAVKVYNVKLESKNFIKKHSKCAKKG